MADKNKIMLYKPEIAQIFSWDSIEFFNLERGTKSFEKFLSMW
jgi:hypothetical protein